MLVFTGDLGEPNPVALIKLFISTVACNFVTVHEYRSKCKLLAFFDRHHFLRKINIHDIIIKKIITDNTIRWQSWHWIGIKG